MKKRFTLILASMFLALGAWAQTTVYLVKEATTTLTDGTYVLVAMSSNGVGPCYYSSSEGGNRLYRYDLSKTVQVGDYIDDAKYIWTIDETTTDGTQKITVTNVGDATKAFPNDTDKNKNFQGSGVAELIPEIRTINGIDYLTLKLADAAIGYIHANTPGGNPNLSYWNSVADDGTCVKFRFYPVEAKQIEEMTLSYSLTDEAGNTYEGNYEAAEGAEPTFTGITDYTFSNVVWNGSTFTATINFPFPVSSAEVINATYIKCTMSGYDTYFYIDSEANIRTKSTRNTDKSYLPTASKGEINKWSWAIYPALAANGEFTFKIKNIYANKYITGTAAVNLATADDTGVNFCWGACMGSGNGFYLANSTNIFFAGNSSTAGEQNAILWNKSGNSHMGGNLSFVPTAYTVTIGSTGYSTLYTPIKVAVPDGITAYTGELNGEWLTLTEVENVIPANTAVVLQGDANTYTFNASSAEATEIENNDLTGSTETVATSSVEGTVYTLQSHNNGGVAFKRYTGTNLTGFKAYLAVESQAQAIRIRKGSEEGTTSIENAQLTMDNENVVIYDLQGRRVEKMEKGIYIVNGKKIIK